MFDPNDPSTVTEVPTTPTPATFAGLGLDGRIVSAMARRGFLAATEVQARTIPPILEGKDLVGLSQTGSGKTLAFLLPAIHRLLGHTAAPREPRLLVVTPTRELALQIGEEAESALIDTNMRVATVFGGRGMKEQSDALRNGATVVIATPGRLLDHVHRKHVVLSGVAILVLDEADRMLDMGFIDDIRRIAALTPRTRQTLLFGATLPPEIELLSADFQRSPVVIEVARRKPPESIEQVLFPVGPHLKSDLLQHLLSHEPAMESVLVFVDTKRDTDIVARQLREAHVPVALMHGDRTQVDREKALERLRDRTVRVLVATNVASRGLDVEDISHVVNYDVPRTVDEYVHRIGRTARAEAKGSAYTFVTPADEGAVIRIEAALERTIPRRMAPAFDYDVPTPSWAQTSSRDVSDALSRVKTPADLSRRVRFRR